MFVRERRQGFSKKQIAVAIAALGWLDEHDLRINLVVDAAHADRANHSVVFREDVDCLDELSEICRQMWRIPNGEPPDLGRHAALQEMSGDAGFFQRRFSNDR